MPVQIFFEVRLLFAARTGDAELEALGLAGVVRTTLCPVWDIGGLVARVAIPGEVRPGPSFRPHCRF